MVGLLGNQSTALENGCDCPIPCGLAIVCPRLEGNIVPCMMGMQGKVIFDFSPAEPNPILRKAMEARGWKDLGAGKWELKSVSDEETEQFDGQCPYERRLTLKDVFSPPAKNGEQKKDFEPCGCSMPCKLAMACPQVGVYVAGYISNTGKFTVEMLAPDVPEVEEQVTELVRQMLEHDFVEVYDSVSKGYRKFELHPLEVRMPVREQAAALNKAFLDDPQYVCVEVNAAGEEVMVLKDKVTK